MAKERRQVCKINLVLLAEQWIKVSQDFLLMDTPGILPMNYEDQQKATKLALIGFD